MFRTTGGTRPARLAAVAALTVALFGAAGCASPEADERERFAGDTDVYRFSAGDGVNVEGTGPLEVRNVIVVANDEGTEGQLIAAIVNDTDMDHVLSIAVGEGSPASLEIDVPAQTTISFGAQDSLEEPPRIENLDSIPGSMVEMTFHAGDSEPVTQQVPVLAGCQPYLDELELGEDGEECT